VESDEQPKNRRARRAAEKGADEEGASIKDRNQRLRADAAAGRRKVRDDRVARASAEGLDASERLDDVFLRSSDAAGKFLNRYATGIQSLIVLAAAAGMGYLIWDYRNDAAEAKLGDRIAEALNTENARLASDTAPKKTEFGLTDTRPEFAEEAAKQKASLEKWRALEKDTPSQVREFAVLGEAGSLLDAGETAEAQKKYQTLTSSESPLIKTRAYEGLILTFEAAKDLEGALKAAQSLKDVTGQGDLGTYHEARLRLAQGDQAKALELVTQLKEKLSKGVGPLEAKPYLLDAVEDLKKTLQPEPVEPGVGGLTPEQMAMLQRQIEEMQKKQAEGGTSAPPGPIPLDPGPLAPVEPAPPSSPTP
jgi:hypothetical protein